MLDEVLEGEAVLLDSGHRLVKQVLQAHRLTLLLTCRGGEKIKVMSNSYSWYWLDIFLQLFVVNQAMRVRIRILVSCWGSGSVFGIRILPGSGSRYPF
jgi:hypothetical protein